MKEQRNQSKVLRPGIVRPFGVRGTAVRSHNINDLLLLSNWFDWTDYSLLRFNLLLLPVWMSKNHVFEKVQKINSSTCWTVTHSLFVPDQNLTENLHRHRFLLLLTTCSTCSTHLTACSKLIDGFIFRFCVCSKRECLSFDQSLSPSPSVVWQLHKGNIKPSFERCERIRERILKVTCDPII